MAPKIAARWTAKTSLSFKLKQQKSREIPPHRAIYWSAGHAETIYATYIDFVRWVMDILWEMGLFCSWNRKEFIGF